MSFHVIGARGRLGQAIASEYGISKVSSLPRAIYEGWSVPGRSDQVARHFESNAIPGDVVFVASGLLDPALPDEVLRGVNFQLPKNVIDGATKVGLKVVTFGTIMENLLTSKNPYIQSKADLAEYAGHVIAEGKSVIHLRIHTLYGLGQPIPFMFLGQIQKAILENQPFRMTSGRQLREYHHFNDEAKAIRIIVGSIQSGLTNLSHGNPLSLHSIAQGVFEALGREDLLQVGTLHEPPEENYATVLEPSPLVAPTIFRESLPAIIEHMQACCEATIR